MNMRYGFTLLLLGILAGCSEGGTGGTGGITPPPLDMGTATTSIAGFANKGPLAAAASVTLAPLSATGVVGETLTMSTTSGNVGEFLISAAITGPVIINASGDYFSEITGTAEGAVNLSMVAVPTELSEIHNINLLTTITTPRIQALMANGIAADQAITMAETELLQGFNSTLGSIDNTNGFSRLLLFAELQTDIDLEGNSYLLALSSLFEQVAQTRALSNDLDAPGNMQAMIESVANDLSADGVLTQPELLAEILVAMQGINPDQILLNLFLLQPSFQSEVLTGTPLAEESNVSCSITRGELVCLAGGSNAVTTTLSATNLIADLDRFIDTDGDGTVNNEDLDDDNDGIEDANDETPYGN